PGYAHACGIPSCAGNLGYIMLLDLHNGAIRSPAVRLIVTMCSRKAAILSSAGADAAAVFPAQYRQTPPGLPGQTHGPECALIQNALVWKKCYLEYSQCAEYSELYK